jgi:hypothetical protein
MLGTSEGVTKKTKICEYNTIGVLGSIWIRTLTVSIQDLFPKRNKVHMHDNYIEN